jgi:hypothetical protein
MGQRARVSRRGVHVRARSHACSCCFKSASRVRASSGLS